MTATTRTLRHAFAHSLICFVKVTPGGFLLSPQGVGLPEDSTQWLIGRVRKAQLTRKRFDDNVPVCHSKDGITAEDGTSCQACQHPLCRPWLRIQLVQPRCTCIIELNATSANNFFAIEDQAQAQGCQIQDWTLKLTVENHDRWGEVRFERTTLVKQSDEMPTAQPALPHPSQPRGNT